jgi:hypothetical protein
VSFGGEQSLVAGFGPALAAADLNGDTHVVWLDETTSAPTLPCSTVSKRLAGPVAGDFNQDGWPDIATVDTDGILTFLLNEHRWRAKGSFTVHSSITVMASPQQLLLVAPFRSGLPRIVLRKSRLGGSCPVRQGRISFAIFG